MITWSNFVAALVAGTCLVGCSPANDQSGPVNDEPDAGAADAAGETRTMDTEPAANAESTKQTASVPGSAAVTELRQGGRVSFEAGRNGATVEGSIKGYETVDYVLNVQQGQDIEVSMATDNTALYFNIYEPGETDMATFVGSISGNRFEGVAAKSGDYRIRVYMMRSAARRDEAANYRLEMIAN